MRGSIRHIVACLLASVLLFTCSGCSLIFPSSQTAEQASIAISGSVNELGECWFPTQSKEPSIHFSSDVQQAFLSGDRKSVVVLDSSGKLYYAPSDNLDNQTIISDSALKVLNVRNDGFIYQATSNGDTSYFRCLFTGTDVLALGNGDYAIANDNTSVIYADDDHVKILAASSNEPYDAGAFEGTFAPVCVSNSGSVGTWTISDDEFCTVYLFDSGEREKLDKVEAKYNNTYTRFTKDNSALMIGNTNSSNVYIKLLGQDTVEVTLPGNLDDSSFFGIQGNFSDLSKLDSDAILYVSVESDDYGLSNLYSINLSGERDRVLSNIREHSIKNGHIYYTDQENVLYSAEINSKGIDQEKKVSNNVYTINLTPDGTGICYGKNIGEDEVGSLYYYSSKSNESTRISTTTGFIYIDLDSINSYFAYDYSYFSADGKYLYYFEELKEISDSYTDYGTLCRYNIKENESEELLDDALPFISSIDANGYINADYFWAEQYISYENDQILSDLIVFDHGVKNTLAQGIIH